MNSIDQSEIDWIWSILDSGNNRYQPINNNFSNIIDGQLPIQWNNSTWGIVNGKAINNPAFGNNLVNNGNFDIDISGWSDGSILPAIASWNLGHLKLTVTAGQAYVTQSITTVVGKWYKFTFTIGGGIVAVRVSTISKGTNISSAAYNIGEHSIYFMAISTTTYIGFTTSIVGSFTVDSVSVVEMITSNLFATIRSNLVNGIVRTALHTGSLTPAGVVTNLDNPLTPTNYIIAYHDGGSLKLIKFINSIPTVLINQIVTYVSGALIQIETIPETHIVKLYYNGIKYGTDVIIADQSIIFNRYHGLFAVGSPNITQFDNFSMIKPPIITPTVFLGGSITVGCDSTNRETMSYRAITMANLQTMYQDRAFTFINSGISATGSWYSLFRLVTDVIVYNPKLIIIDFAVNDFDNDTDRASAEALIRRIRTALPNAHLACVFHIHVIDQNGTDTINVKQYAHDTWATLCNHYSIPFADYAAEVQTAVAAGEHELSWYFLDDYIHPSNNGHSVSANLLKYVLSPFFLNNVQYTPPLPQRIYDNGDYENLPITRNGTDNDGITGAWEILGNSIISTGLDSTVEIVATCNSFGLDSLVGVGSGIIGITVDNNEECEYDLSEVTTLYKHYWSGSRSEHRFIIRVISENIQINRFLIL